MSADRLAVALAVGPLLFVVTAWAVSDIARLWRQESAEARARAEARDWWRS